MRLPAFEYIRPKTAAEALEAFHQHGPACKALAGGTDILVRMKQRLAAPSFLVSLKDLTELSYVRRGNETLNIGACASIDDIRSSKEVDDLFPGLARAAFSVGAPSIQHFTGTIGGNICQENRCKYYNQSEFFRSARPPCHKAGGQTCYARDGSDRCRSTCHSDLGPVLTALNASVVLKSKGVRRTLPMSDFYTSEGEKPFSMAPEELMTEIRIPIPPSHSGNAYKRLAARSAIDYPIVSAAVFVEAPGGVVARARIVVGAIGSAPLSLAAASRHLEGKAALDSALIKETAEMAMNSASAFAVDNVSSPLEYRIQMIAVMVERALVEAVGVALGNGCAAV